MVLFSAQGTSRSWGNIGRSPGLESLMVVSTDHPRRLHVLWPVSVSLYPYQSSTNGLIASLFVLQFKPSWNRRCLSVTSKLLKLYQTPTVSEATVYHSCFQNSNINSVQVEIIAFTALKPWIHLKKSEWNMKSFNWRNKLAVTSSHMK